MYPKIEELEKRKEVVTLKLRALSVEKEKLENKIRNLELELSIISNLMRLYNSFEEENEKGENEPRKTWLF